MSMALLFQSTPLMRGETIVCDRQRPERKPFQSTPLVRGETPRKPTYKTHRKISIHSPHARGDLCVYMYRTPLKNFNPLPSCEGRPPPWWCSRVARNFNPLPSCEGRPFCQIPSVVPTPFQSTPLMRGETILPNPFGGLSTISIHSPHARGDGDSTEGGGRVTISIHSPHARGDFSSAI